MDKVIGRAGFHAEHAKKVGERRAIVHEMMRELDEDSIAYWAKRNPNIVVADEVLNEAMVNDGAGGFRVCSDRQDVLDYGADRVRRVKRKFRDDTFDQKTKTMRGGTVTTSLIVSHLPKSMCVEVPGYYPVLDEKTGGPAVDADGEPLMRGRWIARDRDEARRYFQDVVRYMSDNVIPGGFEAVLGYDIQHSESTPHVQILADTFAEDPKVEEGLRVESSRAWFSHRDVKDEAGKQKSGRTKMKEYHVGLKQHLVDLGYDISVDFDEERHLVGMGKDEYGQAMDAKRVALEHAETIGKRVAGFRSEVAEVKQEFSSRDERLAEREGILDRREADLPRLRRKAVDEAKQEGQREGFDMGRAAAKIRADKVMQHYIRQLRSRAPRLFDEFLDHEDIRGRSYRPFFDKFVDQRLEQFKSDHGVTDQLELEPGDLQVFIEDGGEQLAAEIAQLQSERQLGD